ncbi:MAG: glycoside hydrolase family 130 protein [Jatrophihabitantaceae bacterium]
MSLPTELAHRVQAQLDPDPSRVIARLFLPGEELPNGRSRAGAVVDRVLALPEAEVEIEMARLVAEFGPRHREYPAILAQHASMVKSHTRLAPPMSPARTLLMGASFTAEYAVEGAALCNPSAVLHPDQSGLGAGQARVAISLRAIGEGHLSSIGFATAVIGPDAAWSFDERTLPATVGRCALAHWDREHLRAVLADHGPVDELAHSLLATLPESFDAAELQRAITSIHSSRQYQFGTTETIALLRKLVASAYVVTFGQDVALSEQVLMPAAAEESNGMEDARFTRFVDENGAVQYRATYTAYDGRHIEPRLLTSPDLNTFQAHRLAGPAAQNKGMALFPRKVDGRFLALCRSDGENTSMAVSTDGFIWGEPLPVQGPTASWEVLQVGNCGPPIETERGWLVLTHGVGPMRSYAIGAILLDLQDPTRVLGRLPQPLLQTLPEERDGYVPNVVYSCGGVLHEGRLWLPYGIGDARIGVMWADVDELLGAMIAGQSA